MNPNDCVQELPPRRGVLLLLPDHHRRLAAMCNDLLACVYTADTRELATRWSALEDELLDHMAAEEEIILPHYVIHDYLDAQRIRDDHARIRQLIAPMGLDVELHEARADRLRRLIDEIRIHAMHEDAKMYPWANSNLPIIAEHQVVSRAGCWLKYPGRVANQ